MKTAIAIGNSDGIGLESTRLLLAKGYRVIGLSKSPSPIADPAYAHRIQDVTAPEYVARLREAVASLPRLDLCIYFAGIGNPLDLGNLAFETKVFEVNLMAAVRTTEIVVGHMRKAGFGHFIGLSSCADLLTSDEAPSYCASKGALTQYWEGLALAMLPENIRISNIRFGFVDTKVARAGAKPFLMTVPQAAEFVLDVVRCPRVRATKPRITGVLVWVLMVLTRLRLTAWSLAMERWLRRRM